MNRQPPSSASTAVAAASSASAPARRLVWLLVALPVALQALFVRIFGVNMLVWDEFFYVDYVRAIRSGGDWLPWLWRQHNEHRVLPMKLAMWPIARFTHWDNRTEMYVCVVLAAAAIWGLRRIDRESGAGSLLVFSLAAWFVCNFSQFQNMLYGIQMCYYFTVLGVVLAVAFLSRARWSSFGLAVLGAFMASYCTVNGFAVWPAGLLLLALRRDRLRGAIPAWLVAGVACVLLYASNFQMPHSTPRPQIGLASLRPLVSFSLAMLGQSLGGGSYRMNQAVGLALIVLLGLLLWARRGTWRSVSSAEAPLWALIGFSLASSALTAVGRFSFGRDGLAPRYVAYSMLALIGAYLLADRTRRGADARPLSAWLMPAVTAVLLVGLMAANLDGIDSAIGWRRDRLLQKFELQTADVRSDKELQGIYFASELRRMIPYLRAERLGPFSGPDDLLLGLDWQAGQPAGPVLAGSPIEQTLVCPVDKLRDVAVSFANGGRRNPGPVTVSVWEGQLERGRRTFVPGEIMDNQWVEVRVRPAIAACQGRRLKVRIESPATAPGEAVTAWTYPRYYAGELTQASGPSFAERSLALDLNAFHYGVLP